ncbi:hypothetical protein [Streptomyces sp. NPDC003247]|uniref:hypothetical protein n=1 Tax=Streptomyces sp. NPDC003247 TaxID=3364677 RepID=UPI003687B68D
MVSAAGGARTSGTSDHGPEITAEMFLKASNTVGGDSSAAGTAAADYATQRSWRTSQTAQVSTAVSP